MSKSIQELLKRYVADRTYSFGHLRKIDVNTKGKELETPLHMACTRNDIVDVILLLENGADVHAKDMFGETPMHRAATGDFAIVRALIKYGGRCDVMSSFGETPLSIAQIEERSATVELMHASQNGSS